MHLVVHQVVQLEHVHVTDGDRSVEGIAGAAVVQRRLTAVSDIAGHSQQRLDLVLGGAVEHRRCHRHTAAQVLGQSRAARRR
jgi:hypothetical protein